MGEPGEVNGGEDAEAEQEEAAATGGAEAVLCYKWRLTLRPATAKPPGQLPYGYFHSPGLATNCEPSVTCAATKTRAQKIQKKAKENTVWRKGEGGAADNLQTVGDF